MRYSIEYLVVHCNECDHRWIVSGNLEAARRGKDPYKFVVCDVCGSDDWTVLRSWKSGTPKEEKNHESHP